MSYHEGEMIIIQNYHHIKAGEVLGIEDLKLWNTVG